MKINSLKHFKTGSLPEIISCFLMLSVALQACNNAKKVYKSSCDSEQKYKHVAFTSLVDSIEKYDKQYVEVEGTYVEGKGESALVNDSTFTDHSSKHALWINFSQDCPLYLEGTRTGLFEYNDGTFTQINNKKITIRGRIDVQHKAHPGGYKASMDRVSFIKL